MCIRDSTDAEINPLRNKRDVWTINTVPFKGGHYAAYPPKLVETCLLAGVLGGSIGGGLRTGFSSRSLFLLDVLLLIMLVHVALNFHLRMFLLGFLIV